MSSQQTIPALDELRRRVSRSLAYPRRSLAYLRRHALPILIIVATGIVAVLLVSISRLAARLWNTDLGGNVAAEALGVLLGALLSLFVIQRILERRHERDWEKVRDIAARRFAAILYECFAALYSALGRGGGFQFGGGGFDDTRYVVGLILESRRQLFEDSNQFFQAARERIRDHSVTHAWVTFHKSVLQLIPQLDASLSRFGGRLPPELEAALLAVEKALGDTDRMLVEFKLHRVPEDPNIGYVQARVDSMPDFLALACTQLWETVQAGTGPVIAALDTVPDVSGSRILEPPDLQSP